MLDDFIVPGVPLEINDKVDDFITHDLPQSETCKQGQYGYEYVLNTSN